VACVAACVVACVVACGEVFFPLPTKRKPSPETGAAHIICHPELAKDLTAGQPALSHHSTFSELTAPPDEPSVPSTCRLKRTSESPREIPSTDSGQALRKLPMNLPERRGVRESGEHTRLACWRRRPADADFQSPQCIAATPRAKFAPRRDASASTRDGCVPRNSHSDAISREDAFGEGAKGRTRGRVRSPEAGAMPGSCPTITLALWRG